MPIEGVDYSDARPGGARLAQEGKRFAVRYLSPYLKGLTAAEVQDLHAHGVQIPVVFEGVAGGMRGGRAQGVSDARVAQVQLAGLPLPHNLPIYFAKDYDGGLGPQEIAYLAGAASVIGPARVGLYGGYDAIHDAITGRHAEWFWQTYAWSGGRIHPGIHLYQYQNDAWGGSVDFTRALQAEYGQNPPHTTHPMSSHTVQEDDMLPVYFKGDKSGDIFILNRATGTKRHITHPEWQVAGYGQHVLVIGQADADQIPVG